MNSAEVAHRFANMDWGKRGTLRAGSVSCSDPNYYSYSTVFAQWIDKKKKVVVLYHGHTSMTSNKHKLYSSYFADDVHTFDYDDKWNSRYSYGYHGCNLGSVENKDYGLDRKFELLNYFVHLMYLAFEVIPDGKTKGLEKVNFEPWNDIVRLCKLYPKDISINKWIKRKDKWYGKANEDIDIKIKMVKLLNKGVRDVPQIVDALFGDGAFKRYYDYCDKFRKAEHKRVQTEWLCHRLGFVSPYGCDYYDERVDFNLGSVKALRKLTAKERNEIHFRNLSIIEYKKHKKERDALFRKRKRNAYRWIVGDEPVIESAYSDSYKSLVFCRNMYTGEVYDLNREHSIDYFYHFDYRVDFDFVSFRCSNDKAEWIRNFYAKCDLVQRNVKAQDILRKINAHYVDEKISYSIYKRYLDDEYLAENTTPEELSVCRDFIRRFDTYLRNKELAERAERIRRAEEEAERKRAEEIRQKMMDEELDVLLSKGDDGLREIWRKHYREINFCEDHTGDKEKLFHNGNVLLRFNTTKKYIETSMNVRVSLATCKKFWPIIKGWHEGKEFKSMVIDTKIGGKYSIVSYENDILEAGCHKISYYEMERMWNEILENEKEVA